MKIEMTAKPVFHFDLNPDQLRILLWCSEHHYDAVCKGASRVGGFIYGWKGRLTWIWDNPLAFSGYGCHADATSLDICCKILEGTFGLPESDRQIAIKLSRRFKDCLEQSSKIHELKFDVE